MYIQTGPDRLRIVGKGWEVRAALRRWSSRSLTLTEWLQLREQALCRQHPKP
ncbi:Z-ring formation inhibitor MciZ [Desmospora activa]|uniref:Uncharacterized protein DUF3936 n=1 Tax=Desmospora activa DSM 45169 TaxID=1121389 RepID=A0A2T4Z9L8_9BACL|nr:Z-ring formation inhibitor MciZ [Desmospora activa]PTM58589.1 uncharacterized protein DUF3936 [Desmospora activa DSM 45169]